MAALCLIQSWATPCLAALPPNPGGEAEVTPDAREQFRLGVSLLQDPDGARYDEAFKAFLKAYELSPSWKILGNLGLCAMKSERYAEGIEAYERYLAQSGDGLDPAERKQVERDLRIMKSTSGTLTLLVQGAASATVEDTRTRNVGGAVVNQYDVPADGRLVLTLATGKHSLVVEGEGKRASLQVVVQAGASTEQTVVLSADASAPASAHSTSAHSPSSAGLQPVESTQEESSASGLRTAGLIVGGVGVAALVGGGITGFIGLGKKSDLDDKCPNGECRYSTGEEKSSLESDKDSLATLGTITTALLIGGSALTATGVTLFVLGGPTENEQVTMTPTLAPGFAGVSAKGAF